MKSIKKYLFFILGILSLSLGIIGIFLPLLPTTPFLILSAFSFSKSSDQFYYWLVNHKLFGPPIQDWQKHRRIAVKYKVLASITILGSAAYLLTRSHIPYAVNLSFCVFALIFLVYIWSIKNS